MEKWETDSQDIRGSSRGLSSLGTVQGDGTGHRTSSADPARAALNSSKGYSSTVGPLCSPNPGHRCLDPMRAGEEDRGMRAEEGSRPPRGPDSQLKPCPFLEGFSPEMLCATYLWLQLVEDFFFCWLIFPSIRMSMLPEEIESHH